MAEPTGALLLGSRGAPIPAGPKPHIKWTRVRGTGRYGCRREQALWAEEQFTCRRRGVRPRVGRAIMVRNAFEMVVWWDAQVPDRLPWYGRQAA